LGWILICYTHIPSVGKLITVQISHKIFYNMGSDVEVDVHFGFRKVR